MFHLWPQGRIVRICVMIMAAIIAADLATGAWAGIAVYREQGSRGQLALGLLYSLLSLSALVAGVGAAGPHRKAVGFLIEVQDEMTKVEWPKPSELWRRTLVVALAIAVIAGVVLLTDLALFNGLEFIQKKGSP